MKNKLVLITSILLFFILKSNGQNYSKPWNNNALKGFVFASDSISVSDENGNFSFKKIKEPLESAVVMLFTEKKQAETMRDKFTVMISLYDSLKNYSDSARFLLDEKIVYQPITGLIDKFIKLGKNQSIIDATKAMLDTCNRKYSVKDSTFATDWKSIFANIEKIYNEDTREISAITKYGSETDKAGKYIILSNETDKPNLKYLLAGLLGYDFALYEINESLPDTIILADKIFKLKAVSISEEGGKPIENVYKSKEFSFTDNRPQFHDFDAKIYFQGDLKPTDLSIGFGEYVYYYTYQTGAYVGKQSVRFFKFVFSGTEKKETPKNEIDKK